MTIAVDFDGTIVEHKYPSIGREIPGAVETLKRIAAEGHKLILWTVRDGKLLDDAIRFCEEKGLVFYAINANSPGDWSKETSRKLNADVFIDDCNLGGLPDWSQIYIMIHESKTWGDIIESAAHESSDFDAPVRKKKKRRKGPLGRLRERCREARYNLGSEERPSRRAHHHF